MNTGGNNMGNIGADTAGIFALLADTARAGRGWGGGWGGEGGYPGYGVFASPGANAVRLNRNNDAIRSLSDRNADQSEETRRLIQSQNTNANISDGFNRICERINTEATANRDLIFQQELRNGDRLRDLQKEMNDNARIAAQCCCDLKLQACEDKAQIIAEVKAVETRAVERDLNRAERRLETQTILTQCGCGCQGGVRPCPPPFPPQG